MMLASLQRYRALLAQYGLRRCAFRLAYDLRRRYGLLKRRFPAFTWEQRPLRYWLRAGVPADPAGYRAYRRASATRFFFPPGQAPRADAGWRSGAVREAQALCAGRFRYFSALEATLGYPQPDWFGNPFTGQRANPQRHWCEQQDFDPQRGDIKFIWEPARFGWAYALARAYAADPQDEYADTFWRLLEHWRAANPPQLGPHWMCGQEIAIRLLACVFALHAFWDSAATTDERVVLLVELLAAWAERIAGNIDAARNQMGNHAPSEAAGLLTVGLLFPELHGAASWRELGRHVLEDEVRQYNFPDGSYVQHSTNYQRLMLQIYLWCLRLAELNGVAFSALARERLARSCAFLYQLQDPDTGRLPNYGPNDGALPLPLSDCDCLDYRPLLSALHYLLHRERLYPDGPWNEDLLWLCGPESLAAPVQPPPRTSRDFANGGYYTVREGAAWGLVRCHTYRNRPNQADMLHLDLWWRGVNVLRDSGTFSYYDPDGQWSHYFASTAAHNTLTVGERDQMLKGPRFQWFSLVRSRFLGRRAADGIQLWAGEHYGYQRLACRATHRRSIVCLDGTCWLVVDDVLGSGADVVRLYWHLPDLAYQMQADGLTLETPQGPCRLLLYALTDAWEWRVFRGVDADGLRAGWESLYYGVRRPAPTIRAGGHTRLPARFLTLLALGVDVDVQEVVPARELTWRVPQTGTEYRVALAPPQADVDPIASIQRDGQPCALRS